MTSGPESPSLEPPGTRPLELALARAHLRLGSLALARTELEILAGNGALDMPGRVDLAEVRWRSGDLAAAGEAATAAIAAGEDDPIALAIAAEAAVALGRPNEGRRLAARALERVDGPIDALFAGMPRSAVWPADLVEPAPIAPTMFHHEPGPAPSRRARDTDPDAVAARAAVAASAHGAPARPMTLGLWEGEGSDAEPELPDAATELDGGRAALASGSTEEAALRLGLALRLAPALAPAILEATDGFVAPMLRVVRGDAYRLLGMEAEAQRAYAAATWSGSRDRRARPEEDDEA